MPNTFESHVVLVTGAAGGIGGATAAEFAAHGAEVVLADLSAPDELAATLTAKFEARCRAVAMDVTSSDSIASAFAAVGRDVSIVVNNAGVMQRLSADHHTLPEADLDRMLAVHVSGAAKVAAAALPAESDSAASSTYLRSSAMSDCNAEPATARRRRRSEA